MDYLRRPRSSVPLLLGFSMLLLLALSVTAAAVAHASPGPFSPARVADSSAATSTANLAATALGGPNGCSGVQSQGADFDFRDACNFHDLCYMNYTYGRSEAGRFECDRLFYNRMVSHCTTVQPSSRQPACLNRAHLYAYVLVTGYGFFYQPNRDQRAGPPTMN